MNTFQEKLESVISPIMGKFSNNRFFKSISDGFIVLTPIIVGSIIIAILANIPIEGWQAFLTQYNLLDPANAFLSLTMSMLAVLIAPAVAYSYVKNTKENAFSGALLALVSFLALIPLTTAETGEVFIDISYLGSQGIFVSMILGVVVAASFVWIMEKGIKIKLPDSVPPNIVNSLAPSYAAVIILTTVFFIRWGFTFTEIGNIFGYVMMWVAKPLMGLAATPYTIILLSVFRNFLWFFGIHPNALLTAILPVLSIAGLENVTAFQQGLALPYLAVSVTYVTTQIGGAGNTLGLSIATMFAKSSKYKEMRKLTVVPNIFNINEPIIFGYPVMLNPIYLFPMLFTPIASGVATLILLKVLPLNLNPLIRMPSIMPGFITAFAQGGLTFLIIWLVSLFLHYIIYLPFFKYDDNLNYKLEQEEIH